MPDYPSTTHWLSKEEKHFAQWRLAQDVAGEQDDRDAIAWKQALNMAYADYRLYLFVSEQYWHLHLAC
jgi:hypothetical protein